MSEDSNSSTDSDGSEYIESDSPQSSTSSASFKSDDSKGVTINFKDEQSSPTPGQQIPFSPFFSIPHVITLSTESVGSRIMIPGQQIPFSSYYSIPHVNTSSTESVGSRIMMVVPCSQVNTSSTESVGSGNMERGRKRKQDESSTNMDDSTIHQSKRPHISPFIPEQQRPDCPDVRMSERHSPVIPIVPIKPVQQRPDCPDVRMSERQRQAPYSSLPMDEPVTSGEALKSDQSKDERSSLLPEQQRPDCPDLRKPEESNWSTFTVGLLNVKRENPQSTSSSVSFKSNSSKDIIINFKDGRSSHIPDCLDLKMTGESNWSTFTVGLGNKKRENPQSTSSSVSFKSDCSKDIIINFKDGRSSLIPDCPDLRMPEESNWSTFTVGLGNKKRESPQSTASSVSFKSDSSKDIIINFNDERSSSIPDCQVLRMSGESNWSTFTVGLGNKKKEHPQFTASSVSFSSDGVKDFIIDVKEGRTSPVRCHSAPIRPYF